jgi:hypothetical protein
MGLPEGVPARDRTTLQPSGWLAGPYDGPTVLTARSPSVPDYPCRPGYRTVTWEPVDGHLAMRP